MTTRSKNLHRARLLGYRKTRLFFLTEAKALKVSARMANVQGINHEMVKVPGGWEIRISA